MTLRDEIFEMNIERITPIPLALPERGPITLEARGPRGLKGDPGDASSDHGALTGLADDDHPQYLTSGRGDARYPRIADLDAEEAARAAHEARTDNPHGVTAAQTGAATSAALAAEVSARVAGDAAKADAANVYTKSQTDALVDNRIAAVIGTAPEALDTLGELSVALADSDDAVAALTLTVAGKEAGGTAATLVAAHEAAADPHPQYLRQDEGDARADLRIAAAIGDTVQGYSVNLANWASQATTAFGRGLANLADAAGLTAVINTFTTTLKGLVPAPGAISGRFLSDSGWANLPAPTLGDGTVTNAKLATMAANTVKGSIAGGAVADLSPDQMRQAMRLSHAGAGLWPMVDARSDLYGGPTGVVTNTTTAAQVANRWQFMRFVPNRSRALTRLALRVSTASPAGTTARLAIYRSLPNGLPGALLIDAGTVPTDAVGVIEAIINQAVEAGEELWLASWFQSTPTTTAVAAVQGGAPVGYQMSVTANSNWGAFVINGKTYGAAWPADLTGEAWVNLSVTLALVGWR